MSSFCFYCSWYNLSKNFRQIQIFAQYSLSSGPRYSLPRRPGRASAVDPQPIETKFELFGNVNYFVEGYATSERRSLGEMRQNQSRDGSRVDSRHKSRTNAKKRQSSNRDESRESRAPAETRRECRQRREASRNGDAKRERKTIAMTAKCSSS